MADEEWGEWQDHDGKGCPCVGEYVCTVRRDGTEIYGFAGRYKIHNVWRFDDRPKEFWFDKVVRYRIRKPRELTILEEIIADIPAPTNPKVDA